MKSIVWAVLILAFGLGCGPQYQIVSREAGGISRLGPPSAQEPVKSWEYWAIEARPALKRSVPREVRREFTAFDLSIENRGNRQQEFNLNQFALLNSSGVQRSPVPANEVIQRVRSENIPDTRLSLGFGYGGHRYSRRHRHSRHRFDPWYPFVSVSHTERFPPSSDRNVVFRGALTGGPIVPGAAKRGRLYFQRVEEYPGNRLDLVFLVDGKIRLVFPYEVIEQP